jgi:hypothetical protein
MEFRELKGFTEIIEKNVSDEGLLSLQAVHYEKYNARSIGNGE